MSSSQRDMAEIITRKVGSDRDLLEQYNNNPEFHAAMKLINGAKDNPETIEIILDLLIKGTDHLTPPFLERSHSAHHDNAHLIQFTDTKWTIAHPISERRDLNTLFDCQVTWDGGEHRNGIFVLEEDGKIADYE